MRNLTNTMNSWEKSSFLMKLHITFQGRSTNRMYTSGDQNTLVLQWLTLETAPQLAHGVACRRVIWLDLSFVPKQLWHPPVSWMCWETWDLFSVGILKSCLSNSVVDIDQKNRIEAAVTSVKTDVLQVEPEVSLGRCMLISGVHVEGVLCSEKTFIKL